MVITRICKTPGFFGFILTPPKESYGQHLSVVKDLERLSTNKFLKEINNRYV